MLRHGQMQNSSDDDSGTCGYHVYQISQMGLLWNLHGEWNPLCSVGVLMAPEIDLWHDLHTGMREILTGNI
jgi:hypothetical protein